ncbi:TetR/AcrR family transcriptional regulator [Klebsiella oxytoca]|uniref:TetR/AcrR family transcriptional regulator n=1 Tax=Klebsiella oxytoca TaxID=571 RepID=UPI0035715764
MKTEKYPSSGADSKPLRADAQRNRDAVVKSAITKFHAHGLEVSLDEIARDAGVGVGTLYRHFPSREDLLAAALERKDRDLLVVAEHVQAMNESQEALTIWFQALLEYLKTFGGLQMPVLNAVNEPTSPLAITCDCVLFITENLLKAAQKKGVVKTDITGKQLFQCIVGLSWAFNRTNSNDETKAGVMKILESGYLNVN